MINGAQSLAKTYDNKFAIATAYKYPGLSYDVYFYKINQHLVHDTIYPGSYTYDSLCKNLPIQSGTIDLADCDIVTNFGEIPTLEEYNNRKNAIGVIAYPNPSKNGSIILSFTNTGYFADMELKCFDVYGKETHSEKVYRYQGESKINVANWQKGIYIIIIYSNGKIAGKSKFIVN